ncbi:MAG: carbohydrate binding family 9 domain-containing protein [Candidatus Eisenbacteria bacterium]|uniref:Carbohydrate binding family 9 domain-containing protein n=1 Tax=Eiseniibacteriota bacterium TaxID=2212470 RepID=A0A948W4W8_UNCEI|nr:carbohydrate binding family 9 domain-containing protein [Candidatus Eisenbacteria bacterium]MBU1948121.1 carbohydrate binding family 9 domain-containing protein [Candidatus Eisenbacteria bacterium]MBU2689784.1 carbohydrate binding family 9 domain-containing protein [Candidatus Eisenbacteria bacterium]
MAEQPILSSRWRQLRSILALLPALILASAFAPAIAQSDYTPAFHPELKITRMTGEIKIDGFLEDSGWKGAAVADHFHEVEPGDNLRPPVETTVFATYNDDHLYLSAICYDNPAEIRATLSQRDHMGGDNIGFFIDTYHNATWAYTINVNPFGVQADALWSDGYGEDGMFDLVFESAGRITDSGYQVELDIPFSSLRFPNTEEQTWGIQFWRHHYRDTHYSITWAAQDRNESNWVRNWGSLTGINNVSPGKGIEIIPAWTGSMAGALGVDSDGDLKFKDNDPRGELSLSGKYSVSSNIIIDATVNPDFSNVESDAFQIDVNSATALSYPEKRPFFQEGSDLYRTRLSLVYTRSINEPDFAAKVTARAGKTSISFLSAHDLHSPFIVPFEETSSGLIIGGSSFSNILRVQRTLGSGTQVGAMITNRSWEGGGSGTTYSTDATFRFSRRVTLRAQAVGSQTVEPDNSGLTSGLEGYLFDNGKHTAMFDGESFGGYAGSGNLSYNSRNFYISGTYSETGPTFRADNGWMPRNNRRDASLYSSYHIRFDQGLLERISLELNPMRVWNTDGHKKDEAIFATVSMPLRFYQVQPSYQYMISTEEFAGHYFDDIWNHYVGFRASPSELLTFGGSCSYGNQIAYGYRAIGRQTKWGAWVDLNLFDRLYVENWIDHVKSYDTETDDELFNGYIYGSRISLQYDRRLSLRLFSQYNNFSDTWVFDPLITYQLTPFTLFYVGSTYNIQAYDNLDRHGDRFVAENEESFSHRKLDYRQFFMKVQYLFQP